MEMWHRTQQDYISLSFNATAISSQRPYLLFHFSMAVNRFNQTTTSCKPVDLDVGGLNNRRLKVKHLKNGGFKAREERQKPG
jgi:hypothetical protein